MALHMRPIHCPAVVSCLTEIMCGMQGADSHRDVLFSHVRSAAFQVRDVSGLMQRNLTQMHSEKPRADACTSCRRPILRSSAYDWSLTVDHFGDSFHYFVYRLRRGEAPLRADEDDAVAASNAAPKHVSDMTMHAYHEHMDKEDYLLRTEI